jgi:hypothetical protein
MEVAATARALDEVKTAACVPEDVRWPRANPADGGVTSLLGGGEPLAEAFFEFFEFFAFSFSFSCLIRNSFTV